MLTIILDALVPVFFGLALGYVAGCAGFGRGLQRRTCPPKCRPASGY
jgi:hypothetical protein